MPNEKEHLQKSNRMKWLVIGGVALGLLLIGVVTLVTWSMVAESRRKAKAEETVRSALTLWCSDQPLPDVMNMVSSDTYQFSEFGSRLSTDTRPTGYQITGITRGEKNSYLVAVTLTFLGGAETRLYDVEVLKKSGKCLIGTKASEDISGTESHARSILQAWLDSWVAGESMANFKQKHPEAAGKWTVDTTWAVLSASGKKLVQYDITNAGPSAGGGYRFTVTAVLEERGTPETKILRYTVFKDRDLSGGRWCVTGN